MRRWIERETETCTRSSWGRDKERRLLEDRMEAGWDARGCEGRNLGSVANNEPRTTIAFPFSGGWMDADPTCPRRLTLAQCNKPLSRSIPQLAGRICRALTTTTSSSREDQHGRSILFPDPGARSNGRLHPSEDAVALLGHLRPAIVCSLGRRLTGSGLPLVLHNSDPRLLNRRLGWAGQYETPTVN
jgi:hypothetical protein